MFYPQCKIYNDGRHFIALPHTTRPGLRKRPKPPEELIAVAEKTDDKTDVTNAENNEIEDNRVVFKNYDGTVLSSKTYHYGDKVVEPSTPTKPADNTYTYTFTGWDKEIADCVGNEIYTATYSSAEVKDSRNESLSGGAIAGIATGSAAVVGLGGFSLFWFVIKKKRFSDLFKGGKKK